MGRGTRPRCEKYQRTANVLAGQCAITAVETVPAPVAMRLNTPPTPSGLPQYRTLSGSQHHPREPDATDRRSPSEFSM